MVDLDGNSSQQTDSQHLSWLVWSEGWRPIGAEYESQKLSELLQ